MPSAVVGGGEAVECRGQPLLVKLSIWVRLAVRVQLSYLMVIIRVSLVRVPPSGI